MQFNSTCLNLTRLNGTIWGSIRHAFGQEPCLYFSKYNGLKLRFKNKISDNFIYFYFSNFFFVSKFFNFWKFLEIILNNFFISRNTFAFYLSLSFLKVFMFGNYFEHTWRRSISSCLISLSSLSALIFFLIVSIFTNYIFSKNEINLYGKLYYHHGGKNKEKYLGTNDNCTIYNLNT